jgi:hypothetical protein
MSILSLSANADNDKDSSIVDVFNKTRFSIAEKLKVDTN